MARIFYGVMGDSRGHLSRTTSIVQHMPQHEVVFAGGGTVLEMKSKGHDVVELPMLATLFNGMHVDLPATVGNACKVLLSKRGIVQRLADAIKEYDPDLILTDYEFFTPRAAKILGRPCYSLDHQHVLTHCKYPRPKGQFLNRRMTFFPIQHLYSAASRFLVSSFYQPPPKNPAITELFPPVLRKEVKDYSPSEGEHILVYASGDAYADLLPLLKRTKRKCVIYGHTSQSSHDNFEFRKKSTHGFLEDLASCRYVISNGGHSLISEALYFGKPVLCIPIHLLYEQFLNAYFVEQYGFGTLSMDPKNDINALQRMEDGFEGFKKRIANEFFWGNDKIATRLEQLLATNTNTPSD